MNFTITQKLVTVLTLLSIQLFIIPNIDIVAAQIVEQKRMNPENQSRNLAERANLVSLNTFNKTLNLIGNKGMKEISQKLNDIYLDGTPPISFQRFYSSANQEDIGLGMGWSFSFSDRISVMFDTAVFTNSFGKKSFYIGENYVLSANAVTMKFKSLKGDSVLLKNFQYENPDTIKGESIDSIRIFTKFGEDFHLTKQIYPNGDEIDINRAKDARIITISNQRKKLTLKWSSGTRPRLLSATDEHGKGKRFVPNMEFKFANRIQHYRMRLLQNDVLSRYGWKQNMPD